MDELHRRRFPVEINVKGSAKEWQAIRFYEPGPPEIECFLSFEEENGNFTVSTAIDSPPESAELQLNLIDILLDELGGQADNTATREHFTPQQFAQKLKAFQLSSPGSKERYWIIFAWLVVAIGLLIWFFSPHTRSIAPVIIALSFLSAAGLTYSHFKA
jgi:hypothetical protein